MSAHPLQDTLLSRFPWLTARPGAADGLSAVNVPPEYLPELAATLRDELGFTILADLAGCDWGTDAPRRFGAIYHFQRPALQNGAGVPPESPTPAPPQQPPSAHIAGADTPHSAAATPRLTLRVACDAADNATPALPSLTPLYASANWFEREAYDLLGIRFDGHPALTRLLLAPDFAGHPLRKDFPLGGAES